MHLIQVLKHAHMGINPCFIGFKFAEMTLGFRASYALLTSSSFEGSWHLVNVSLQLESFSCSKAIANYDSRTRQNGA